VIFSVSSISRQRFPHIRFGNAELPRNSRWCEHEVLQPAAYVSFHARREAFYRVALAQPVQLQAIDRVLDYQAALSRLVDPLAVHAVTKGGSARMNVDFSTRRKAPESMQAKTNPVSTIECP
jgi:hypothetical protein